jgi:hypothetical protein
MDEGRFGWLPEVFENLSNRHRLGDKGDEALVPKPRVNLTRFDRVFAPNSRYRAQVTPAKRGRRSRPPSTSA